MKLTLDDFFNREHSAAKHLRENLEANLEMFEELSDEDKEMLMRVNLISIRQCLQDYGDNK